MKIDIVEVQIIGDMGMYATLLLIDAGVCEVKLEEMGRSFTPTAWREFAAKVGEAMDMMAAES